MSNNPITKRQKALIHVAKQQLGLTEKEYRDLLHSVGVNSSKELNYRKFDELMKRFKASGFKPLHKSAKKSGMQHPSSWEKDPVLNKIGAILTVMELPWSYADGIARKMFNIQAVRWCNSDQLCKIVAALSYHQKRHSC